MSGAGLARRAAGLLAGLPALALASDAALAVPPMYYLQTEGPRGGAIADLTWGLIALSVAVVLIISVLVVVGVLLRRTHGPHVVGERLGVTRGQHGVGWIYFGLVLTTVALLGSVVWTVVTMAAIGEPPSEPRLTIEVTGHQWWWEVRYVGADPSQTFETANEIHIPVGEPVRFRLRSADVIHSFWVPRLSGKTDLIPGQNNVTWLQADTPGVYRGQCAEYCGRQHAHMALEVFADPPEAFAAWRDQQIASAAAPETEVAERGLNQFILRCGVCHQVRGTPAGGNVGPDLTHLMSRRKIAAGVLPNTVGHLSGWVANPQFIKPGAKMPNLELSGPELDLIRSYLLTLE